MQRTPVESSNLQSVGYDPASRKLHVEFRGGRIAEYPDVTPAEHQALMDAGSHGRHFHAQIRGRAFRYVN